MTERTIAGIVTWVGEGASLAVVDNELVIPAEFAEGSRGFIPLRALPPREVIRFRAAFGRDQELPTAIRAALQEAATRAACLLRGI